MIFSCHFVCFLSLPLSLVLNYLHLFTNFSNLYFPIYTFWLFSLGYMNIDIKGSFLTFVTLSYIINFPYKNLCIVLLKTNSRTSLFLLTTEFCVSDTVSFDSSHPICDLSSCIRSFQNLEFLSENPSIHFSIVIYPVFLSPTKTVVSDKWKLNFERTCWTQFLLYFCP